MHGLLNPQHISVQRDGFLVRQGALRRNPQPWCAQVPQHKCFAPKREVERLNLKALVRSGFAATRRGQRVPPGFLLRPHALA